MDAPCACAGPSLLPPQGASQVVRLLSLAQALQRVSTGCAPCRPVEIPTGRCAPPLPGLRSAGGSSPRPAARCNNFHVVLAFSFEQGRGEGESMRLGEYIMPLHMIFAP